jgi:hypothetical protein
MPSGPQPVARLVEASHALLVERREAAGRLLSDQAEEPDDDEQGAEQRGE